MRWTMLLGMLLLVACTSQPPTPQGKPLGLLRVDIDLNSRSAQAQFVQAQVSGQAVTVAPINGTNAIGDVQFRRTSVAFHDEAATEQRYVVATFEVINHSSTAFDNLTLYAVNVPGVTQAGSGFMAVRNLSGNPITDAAKFRALKPAHGMHQVGPSFLVNPNNADLQYVEFDEAVMVREQAIAQGIVPSGSTVLGYGFVARNLSGGRNILKPGSTPSDCTAPECRGSITLAYRFPIVSPTEDPARFSMFFIAGNETERYISQSPEEVIIPAGVSAASSHTQETVAGLPFANVAGFDQVRTNWKSNYNGENRNAFCGVITAIPSLPTFTGNEFIDGFCD